MNFDVEKTRIFECIVGSHLYGIANEFSDVDYRGICVPPMESLLNPFMSFEQKDSGFEEDDRVIYGLNKWLKLCADANPNIIEMLFVPEDKVIFKTPAWDKILAHKEYFLSKKVKYTFTGYAFSQLKRIERHRHWLLHPVKKPDRKDFDLPEMPFFGLEKIQNIIHSPPETIASEWKGYANKEMGYRNQADEWQKYQSWVKTRNPERFALEEKFGYDTKHAGHLFRLMSEGAELLLTGHITFPLPNAEEILAIKNGAYLYDDLIVRARGLEQKFEEWYEVSPLPNTPNRKALTKLYFDVIMGDR